jgi:chaperonin cofactor prefoldin|tara:strand:- start:1039 stop:1224 length:186 start_codon:yes stop_codon:yes gene_type:complete
MKEADEAARALRKLQELTNKYSDMELDADGLKQSIKDRVNATEELKEIIRKATEAKRKNNI